MKCLSSTTFEIAETIKLNTYSLAMQKYQIDIDAKKFRLL